jgi:predicted Rossmann fold nucleotide-binding protein DprA/Smf involved in DNA uptake
MKAFSLKRHINPTRQREIMDLLASVYPMPMIVEQIAAEIGATTSHTHAVLYYMRLAGRVVKCGPALYGSVTKTAEC